MIIFLECEKDAYIQNKIVNSSFRADDANTGKASVLSLFKLYDESALSGTTNPIENSRILAKFNLNPIRDITGSNGLLTGTRLTSAKFTLKLFDVLHNDTVPSNFNVVVYPISKSWDEGHGIDSNVYRDVGTCNWLTASGMTDVWNLSGAMSGGYVGQPDIDYITGSTALGDLFVTQNFDDGTEDLSMNITTICSATIAGLIPDQGLVIAFSGTEETDSYSRWTKKFFSRHTQHKEFAPRIEVSWDDSTRDNRDNFVFDATGSLFFYNVVRGALTTVTSASGDQSSLSVEVTAFSASSGSTAIYTNTFTANEIMTGIYSCSFAIDSFQTELTGQIATFTSATFYDYWKNTDLTKAYMTGTFDINEPSRTGFLKQKRYAANITNLRPEYYSTETARMRVFANEINYVTNSSKLPSESQSFVVDKAYYQLRSLNSNEVLIAYDTTTDTTRMSYDQMGMYFDLNMTACRPVGEIFKLEVMFNVDGVKHYIEDVFKFKVIK